MAELPLASVERIIRKEGGASRVSKAAVEEFAVILEDVIADLSAEAATLAKHAGRKTVQQKDVRLARRKGF